MPGRPTTAYKELEEALSLVEMAYWCADRAEQKTSSRKRDELQSIGDLKRWMNNLAEGLHAVAHSLRGDLDSVVGDDV